jgi:cystathionine gamma-lyase
MHDATRIIRAGLASAKGGEPFLAGPVFAAPYHLPGTPTDSPFSYGRFHNPTWSHYEDALAELEGGPAVLFPSGMSASSAVLAVTLRPGSRVVMPEESYYTTRLIAQQYFGAMGAEVVTVKTVGGDFASAVQGAALLWLESPTNPGLDVCDIAALSDIAHAAGALVAVDNTTATALCQKPLALGADFSLASDTKAMTGHADLLMGHVATRDPALADKLRVWRTQMGCIPGPMEVWLAHRSMGTLHVRLERQCRSAVDIATFLNSHDKVRGVRYPGLPSDVSHAIAKKQMMWFGPVISFELESKEAVERFFANSALVHEATSFGGIHTSAERRARWGADNVSEGFVRFSVGLEDVRDLIDDLTNALAHA